MTSIIEMKSVKFEERRVNLNPLPLELGETTILRRLMGEE
jgi:hypothetical protein